MDDESTKLLREMLDVQKEEAELLRKHLPTLRRMRFGLLALLLLTLVSIGLGTASLVTRPQPTPPTAATNASTILWTAQPPPTSSFQTTAPTLNIAPLK